MTIAEKLKSIKASKDAIKQAIEAKGVACGDILSEYAEKIADMPTGGVDMAYVAVFSNWKFTTEQFEALNTYNWDKVTRMSEMFAYCTELTTIPNIDTSNVNVMSNVFMECENLREIPTLDTSNVTSMTSAFKYCKKLTTIPLLDTSNNTNMSSMFYQCKALTSIPQLDTSKVTTMANAFMFCLALVTLPLLDTTKVLAGGMNSIFYACCKLTNLGGFKNLSVSLSLSDSPLLTVESLMNVINFLKDLTGGTAQTLTLGATNLAKLTDEQKAVATSKNWVLA